MLMSEARVLPLSQHDNPVPESRRELVGRGTAPVTVDEGGRALPAIGSEQPTHVAQGKAQYFGRLARRRLASLGPVQHHQPSLLSVVQDHCLLHTVTVSLTTYRVTESLTINRGHAVP